jgi:hypothetical protein
LRVSPSVLASVSELVFSTMIANALALSPFVVSAEVYGLWQWVQGEYFN